MLLDVSGFGRYESVKAIDALVYQEAIVFQRLQSIEFGVLRRVALHYCT